MIFEVTTNRRYFRVRAENQTEAFQKAYNRITNKEIIYTIKSIVKNYSCPCFNKKVTLIDNSCQETDKVNCDIICIHK